MKWQGPIPHYHGQTFQDQDQYRGAEPLPSVNQVLSKFRMAHHKDLLEAADRLAAGESIEHDFDHVQSEKTRRLLLGGALDIAKARGWQAPRT